MSRASSHRPLKHFFPTGFRLIDSAWDQTAAQKCLSMVLAVLHRTLIVTEQCLLSPTRNPNLDRAGIEHLLKVPGLAY